MAHEHLTHWFNMTYTKEQKYEHDRGRSQGRMMYCFGTFSFFVHFLVSMCDSLSELLVAMRYVRVCVHMCSLCVNVWCIWCHTRGCAAACIVITVYMSEWFVYSLSKDQFPLCVCITEAEYFQGWNCLSEPFRELLNVLFTQH